VSLAYPEFQQSHCTRYRYRYSECRRCADACPHEAIALSDSGATLDQRRCRNCALCITACVAGGWAGAAFKPIELLRQVIKGKTVAIACAPAGLAADAVVPCLGNLDGGMLAYLARRRISVTLQGSGHCGACEHGGKGAAQLALNLEARAQLCAGGSQVGDGGQGDEGGAWAPIDLPTATAPAQPISSPRRQLFRRLLGRGVDEVLRTDDASEPKPPVPEKAIRAGPYVRSERRELLQIVCERQDGQPFPMRWHEALPLLRLHLAPGCTACAACFRVCPSGALHIRENPGDWSLVFQADQCVACQACLEVCQPGVLDAEAEFDARPGQPEQVLHRLTKQRCARCDRFFVSPEPAETCGVCRDDEDAFSAIFG
jgi:energy-converting hydrogenase A subunit P